MTCVSSHRPNMTKILEDPPTTKKTKLDEKIILIRKWRVPELLLAGLRCFDWLSRVAFLFLPSSPGETQQDTS